MLLLLCSREYQRGISETSSWTLRQQVLLREGLWRQKLLRAIAGILRGTARRLRVLLLIRGCQKLCSRTRRKYSPSRRYCTLQTVAVSVSLMAEVESFFVLTAGLHVLPELAHWYFIGYLIWPASSRSQEALQVFILVMIYQQVKYLLSVCIYAVSVSCFGISAYGD